MGCDGKECREEKRRKVRYGKGKCGDRRGGKGHGWLKI